MIHRLRPSLLALAPLPLLCSGMAAQGIRKFPPGVDAKIEASIKRGLDYLVRTQDRQGAWRAQGYGAYPTAMTALAGMALIGSGSTPTRGKYWRSVRKATEFLIKAAGPDGVITVTAEEGRSMYGHGFSTMFLAQVYGMEVDSKLQKKLHTVLTKAVNVICRSQSSAGGWYYTPESRADEGSVTVTQMQALRACRNAGIVVPIKTIQRAVDYIRKSANSDGSIRYSLRSGGAGRPAITAAAVAVMYNAGNYDDPIAAKALKYAERTLPVNGSGQGHHFYAQLYMAQAIYQTGDKRWAKYYSRMSNWLMRAQSKDGSWMGDGVGQTYGTAIALTILQLPYSLVPIYQR
ncbi:MAG: terpene cyclase/mutase family protein [Planctomycetes bacterium]|nr:terpene cyclase/mutase family protein [Planctomycetota bacterium]MCB9871459.1 terpene cyclase/mutase family protein [Planctomycetota bacterium]